MCCAKRATKSGAPICAPGGVTSGNVSSNAASIAGARRPVVHPHALPNRTVAAKTGCGEYTLRHMQCRTFSNVNTRGRSDGAVNLQDRGPRLLSPANLRFRLKEQARVAI